MGRPRSEDARQKILEAAYHLLSSYDFHRISMSQIASAAHVSSATIYRWWQSRGEVLLDAFSERVRPALAVPEMASPLARYRAYIAHAAEYLVSPEGQIFIRFFIGIRADEKLYLKYLARYFFGRQQVQLKLIQAAIDAGELNPRADPYEVMDAINAPNFFRWMHSTHPLTKEYAERMFDLIIPAFK